MKTIVYSPKMLYCDHTQHMAILLLPPHLNDMLVLVHEGGGGIALSLFCLVYKYRGGVKKGFS